MYIAKPENVNQFSEKFLKNVGVFKKRILAELIAGILLCCGKRSYQALSSQILDSEKNKTSVRSFFETKNFRSRDILKSVIWMVVAETVRVCGNGGMYVLIFDGTCIQRGGDTQVENAIKYREKKKRGKGKRSTKAHLFTMGFLITPNGTRIPLLRYSYNTRKFCEDHKIKYYTQHEQACMLIEYCRGLVPNFAEFVVIADGFYDSKIIFDTCKKANAIYVTSADCGRVYAPSQKIYDKGLRHKRDSKKLVITKGEEEYTREHIRYASPEPGKKKDVYYVHSEILNVSKLGDIRVVYSWKQNTRKGKKKSDSFKILFCNDSGLCNRKIIELYALRWQIEIYFRELKSEIGLCDYSGKDFRAQERFIDVCLLAYLFLEWDRAQKLKTTKSKKDKGKIKIMRTRGLITLLKRECLEENKMKILNGMIPKFSKMKKAA